MNNIKLSFKLIGGFLFTTSIILTVGLLSIVQQGLLNSTSEKLGREDTPAVQAIMGIQSDIHEIMEMMRTQLSPYISVQHRNDYLSQLQEVRKRYRATKEHFAALPMGQEVSEEWKQFNVRLDQLVEINNQTTKIVKELIADDLTQPHPLKQQINRVMFSHSQAVGKAFKLMNYNIAFEGATDHTNCVLAQWMNKKETSNPEINGLLEAIGPVHELFHRHVAQVKKLVAEGRADEARATVGKQLFEESDQIMVTCKKIEQIVDAANEKFIQINKLQLEEGEILQNEIKGVISAMVEKSGMVVNKTVATGEKAARRGQLVTLVCLILGASFSAVAGIVLTRQITKPLFRGVDLAKAMAGGDFTRSMSVDRQDEIGELAKALNEMATNLRRMITDVNKGVIRVDESSTELTDLFGQLSGDAESTALLTNQVAAAAEEMTTTQQVTATSMEQTAVNVSMVSAAVDEMDSTIQEIASNSGKAKVITHEAVVQAENASQRVNELGRAADLINKVTETITEISEQTNLLALNATIEAARAGEAGKGFAVVANEIKELAKQTAAATLDIKEKILSIQQATGVTVTEINQIRAVIQDVDMIVATIAAAVEEQSATTKEIASNVQQASVGIGEVNENVAQGAAVFGEIAQEIATVHQSADHIKSASNQVKDNAEEMSNIAQHLRMLTSKFKI